MDTINVINDTHLDRIKISVDHLSKRFLVKDEKTKKTKQFTALDDINLDVRESEFVTILGPSGCGKSTLLDILAGLSNPSAGRILIDGNPVKDTGHDRGIVMQGYALFPWRTVQKNIEYGLELRGVKKQERKEIAAKYLKLVNLSGFENRYPHELSGGMKQRVAIARALAYDPEILLMDEPFGALDAQTRETLQDELLKIWEGTRKTIIFVTHSIEEAIYLGDRVVVLSPNPGTTKEIFDIDLPRPRSISRFTKEYQEIHKKISNALHGFVNEGLGI